MTLESLTSRIRLAREPLLWLLALGAAVLTGFGAKGYLAASEARARAAVEGRFHPVPVVVARADLVPGTSLRPEALAIRNMPSDYLPSGSVRAAQASDVMGRTLAHALRAGEPVQTALLEARTEAPLAQRIALGRRAVTIAVDETSAVAGLLRPGDRVDIRWRDGAAPLVNVPVLATGTDIAPGDGAAKPRESADFSTITLELPEAEAERLAGAPMSGLRVILRNPADTGDVSVVRSLVPRRPSVTVPLIVGGGGGPVPAWRLLAEGAP